MPSCSAALDQAPLPLPGSGISGTGLAPGFNSELSGLCASALFTHPALWMLKVLS